MNLRLFRSALGASSLSTLALMATVPALAQQPTTELPAVEVTTASPVVKAKRTSVAGQEGSPGAREREPALAASPGHHA